MIWRLASHNQLRNILSLVKSSQQENNTVLLSSNVPRKDHVDKKGKELNIILEKQWNELGFLMVTLGHVTMAIMTASIWMIKVLLFSLKIFFQH